MSTQLKLRDLVVLCLLREQPRYGYEIKTIIDHLMSHIIDVSSGSLYYGLNKMLLEGYISEASVEKIGRRPERSVYRITDLGEELLQRDLPRVIFPQSQPYFQLDLALFFFDLLPHEERIRRLAMRAEFYRLAHSLIDEFELRIDGSLRISSKYVLRHIRSYIEMELAFVQGLLAELPDTKTLKLGALEMAEVHSALDEFRRQVRPEVLQEPTPASEKQAS